MHPNVHFMKIKEIEEMKSPRCVGTHLQWNMLPDDIVNNIKHPKMICVLRESQDVCVSYYYHVKLSIGYDRDFDQFCDMFLGERVTYGSFWKNVLSYWEQRHRKNILFIKFEDLKKNLSFTIKSVANFLGKTYSNLEVERLCEHLSFESMKRNPSFNLKEFVKDGVNPFIRSGTVGSHRSIMCPEIIEKFATKNKNYFEGTGISFV